MQHMIHMYATFKISKNGQFYDEIRHFIEKTVIFTLKWPSFNEEWSIFPQKIDIFNVHSQNIGQFLNYGTLLSYVCPVSSLPSPFQSLQSVLIASVSSKPSENGVLHALQTL